jgi:hypothetical protein
MLLLRALLRGYPRQARSLDPDRREPWHSGHLLRRLASPDCYQPRRHSVPPRDLNMFAPFSKLSATIRALSSAIDRRRRRFPVINSTRRYAPSSCLASSVAFAVADGYRRRAGFAPAMAPRAVAVTPVDAPISLCGPPTPHVPPSTLHVPSSARRIVRVTWPFLVPPVAVRVRREPPCHH